MNRDIQCQRAWCLEVGTAWPEFPERAERGSIGETAVTKYGSCVSYSTRSPEPSLVN